MTLSFKVQTFALFSFPHMLCASPTTNLASLLNMLLSSASLFTPARSPQDWNSSSTFQTAFPRFSITRGTGNLSSKTKETIQKSLCTCAWIWCSVSCRTDWVEGARRKVKNSPRSGVFLNAHGVHSWWNSQPESSSWHAAEFLPEPLWVRTHLQGQQNK